MTKQLKHPKLWWVATQATEWEFIFYSCEQLKEYLNRRELIALWFESYKPEDLPKDNKDYDIY